jgi:hypothetical protein
MSGARSRMADAVDLVGKHNREATIAPPRPPQINPATGAPLIDISNAPSAMEAIMAGYADRARVASGKPSTRKKRN